MAKSSIYEVTTNEFGFFLDDECNRNYLIQEVSTGLLKTWTTFYVVKFEHETLKISRHRVTAEKARQIISSDNFQKKLTK